MTKYLEIGQIVNTYGIKGYLKIVPYTDDITRFEKLESIYIEVKKELKDFIIEDVKYSKNLVLLKLKGIDDINSAEIYKNCYIKIPRSQAVKLPEDSYFIVDLIGLNVYTDKGEEFRQVIDLYYFQEMKLTEIASVLGIGLPLVKYRLKQARNRLQVFLGKEETVNESG